jgi:hypothetical protein
MTVGTARDLWVAAYGGGYVRRYTPDGQLRPVLPIPAAQATGRALRWVGLPLRRRRHRRSSPTVRSGRALDSLGGEDLLDPRASCNRGREASRRYGEYRRLADLVVC